jgi:hypothetical protein
MKDESLKVKNFKIILVIILFFKSGWLKTIKRYKVD